MSVNGSNGRYPCAGLLEGTDGNFYGTTPTGGDNDSGTMFRVTTHGGFTTLVSFAGSNGAYPKASLLQAGDGNFYGTTEDGGAYASGSVFKITPAGVLSTVVVFNAFGVRSGVYPRAGLVQASDGSFFGTTVYGGPDDYGAVFRLTNNGVLTTLVSFQGSDGVSPQAALLCGGDGYLYGTIAGGGASYIDDDHAGYGTIFRIVMPVSLHLRQSGNDLFLSWRTNAVGFALQSTFGLVPPIAWTDSTDSPDVIGAHFTVRKPIAGTTQFYRLRKL